MLCASGPGPALPPLWISAWWGGQGCHWQLLSKAPSLIHCPCPSARYVDSSANWLPARPSIATCSALLAAPPPQEYCASMPVFARDVLWDAPPFVTSRKGHLRVGAYLASKIFSHIELIPKLATVRTRMAW
jgi:hypothetical protein